MRTRLGDIDVGYTVQGDGPPAVLVHGLAEDRSSWRTVQARLAGVRSHAVDLRGQLVLL